MAKSAEGPFQQLSENIAKQLGGALTKAMEQMAQRMAQEGTGGKAAQSMMGMTGLVDPHGRPVSSNPATTTAAAMGAAASDPAMQAQKAATMERQAFRRSEQLQREVDELSGRSRPETAAMGAYARSRRLAEEAGVKLPALSEEEKEGVKGGIKRAREEIESSVKAQQGFVAELGKLSQQIGAYSRELADLEAKQLSPQEKEKETERLTKLQAAAREQEAATVARAEASAAGARVHATAAKELGGMLPPEASAMAKAAPWMGALGMLATGMTMAGAAPLQLAQREAAEREGTGMGGRMFMRGDIAGQMSMGELGGLEAVRSKAETNTMLKSGGGILAAGLAGAGAGAMFGGLSTLGLGAIPGAIIGGLGGMGTAAYSSYMNYQGNVMAEQQNLIGAQSGTNAEQREAEQRLMGAAGGAFGRARGAGVLRASGMILGREGGGATRAAAMGVGEEEYQEIAARTARMMGVTAQGGVRARQTDTDFAVRMSSLGLGSANDLTSALYTGGARGAGQAQADVSKILEDAVKAGVDQSALPGFLESIASNTAAAGMGGASQAATIAARDIQAAGSAFGGAPNAQEMAFAQRATGAAENAMQSGGDIFGYSRVRDLEEKMKKASGGRFKGLSTIQRRNLARGPMDLQSVKDATGGVEIPGLEGMVRDEQIGGQGFKALLDKLPIPDEVKDQIIRNELEKGGMKIGSLHEGRLAVQAVKGKGFTGPVQPGVMPTQTTGAKEAGDVGASVAATLGRDAMLVSDGFNGLAAITKTLTENMKVLNDRLKEKPITPEGSGGKLSAEQVNKAVDKMYDRGVGHAGRANY